LTGAKYMNGDKTFIDSNVILYLFSNDLKRKSYVQTLFTNEYFISTQVVNENVNVCLRRLKLPQQDAFNHGRNLLNNFQLLFIHRTTIENSYLLCLKYNFSFWDSLIVATALENDCTILLSEDMQDGLIVERKLTIKNPFIGM